MAKIIKYGTYEDGLIDTVIKRMNRDVGVLHSLLHRDCEFSKECEIELLSLIVPTIPKEMAEWIENYVDINEVAIQYVLKDFVKSDAYEYVRDNLEKYGAYDTLLHNAVRYGYRIEGK